MFKVSVLASGSKGNCTVVKSKYTKLLFDAGLSGKKIINALNLTKLKEENVRGVFVSHEHHDHISGAGIICRKLKIPLYITKQTYYSKKKKLGKLTDVRFFESGDTLNIGDLIVDTFPSPHDATDSSNFVVRQKDSEKKLAIITDLGYHSKLLFAKIKEVTTLVIESNHDIEMLMNGPYPWSLKQRVRGKHGHLSNEQAVAVVSRIIHENLNNIVLAHLSEENNKPEIAFNEMSSFLKSIRTNINLIIAEQNKPTDLIDV